LAIYVRHRKKELPPAKEESNQEYDQNS